MAEALSAVVHFAFAEDGMQLCRLYWEAMAGNEGSARVARGAGFRFEGVGRGALVHRDVRKERWSASLLATDQREPADGWPVGA
jgi:RimJ/RimL family protein N-acetyltransferase